MYDPNRAMVMGGGACLINAGFTMSGGAISGNTASSNKDAHGGGVFLAYTDFTMSGGAISGNTVGSNRRTSGGGIAVGMQGTPATFTMSGGIISGNTVNSDNAAMGGGVSVIRGSIFTMSDGTISGNTVNSDYYSWGGGVLNEGDFYFKGGEIKENVLKNSNGSTVYGGGVMNFSPDGFVMSGGAVVTPNPAGSFISPAPGVYTDTRNSIGSDGNLGVYGTLTGNGIAALLDTVDHAVSSSIKLIKAADAADASSGKPVLHDYPYQGSKAPTDRFTLGYFYGNNGLTDIATGAPVIDPTVPQTTPAQWNTAGDGTLMDKPTP
jgi:hypothetical protein